MENFEIDMVEKFDDPDPHTEQSWYDDDEFLGDYEEEPTIPYAELGIDASDVGRSEIRVRRLSSTEWEVVIIRQEGI